MYYFIRWKHTAEGYMPAIPDDVPFGTLAEPCAASEGAEFALFEVELPEGFEESDTVRQVSPELAELVDSAKDYPPALALARGDPRLKSCRHSQTEFAENLADVLVHYLQKQTESPFFVAKATKTEVGYKSAGGYYGIVGYYGEQVSWVSRDYHVYRDPVTDFELNLLDIERRFQRKYIRTP